MTVQAAELRKLIARFDPPLSRMWAAELCGSGAQVSAVAGLEVPRAGEIMSASIKLNWQPSELPGEEFADVRGRGRFTIRTTDQGNVCSDTTMQSRVISAWPSRRRPKLRSGCQES